MLFIKNEHIGYMLTDLKIREFYIPRFSSMSLGQQAHHQLTAE